MEFLEKLEDSGLFRVGKYLLYFLVLALLFDVEIAIHLTIDTFLASIVIYRLLPTSKLKKFEKVALTAALTIGLFYITGNIMFP